METAGTTGGNRRERRRQAILAAARQLFLTHGYGRTTIGDILAVSGGSRSTLMELFGGKEGLFVAVLLDGSRAVEATFETLDASAAPPDVTLRDFARRFAEALLQPDTMAMLAMLAAEGGRFPDIAAAFFRIGPDAAMANLTGYLQRSIAAGHLRPLDPAAMSEAFLGMVLGGAEVRAVVGAPIDAQRAQTLARIDAAVDVFLHGASAGDRKPPPDLTPTT